MANTTLQTLNIFSSWCLHNNAYCMCQFFVAKAKLNDSTSCLGKPSSTAAISTDAHGVIFTDTRYGKLKSSTLSKKVSFSSRHQRASEVPSICLSGFSVFNPSFCVLAHLCDITHLPLHLSRKKKCNISENNFTSGQIKQPYEVYIYHLH